MPGRVGQFQEEGKQMMTVRIWARKLVKPEGRDGGGESREALISSQSVRSTGINLDL